MGYTGRLYATGIALRASQMKSTDIVGYTYRADQYCPCCIVGQLPTGPGGAFDGWGLATGVTMPTEENLSEIAAAFGIDRMNERSFDSDEFPKVVTAEMARSIGQGDTVPTYWETGGDDYADRCGNCGKVLVS